jgi:hypothetical protein
MPTKGRKPNSTTRKKVDVKLITCLACGQTKKPTDFYASSSVFNAATGRVQYCKDCCVNLSCDNHGNIDIEKLKDVLKRIDKPFLPELLQSAYEESKNTEKGTHPLGLYFKNLNSLPQNSSLTWKDSVFDNKENVSNVSENNVNSSFDNFIVTEKIIDKWGFGYSAEEYYNFEKKWSKLIDNYGEKTSLHIEGLKTYIRFRVKEEMATALGNVKDAKDWAGLAKEAATAAKINVSQLSKSDISGGVDLLPQLFEAVESEVGVISILPHLKEQPYDDVDLIIWGIVNYLRRLEDKPRIQYKDIWNFYDEMLSEHFKQKGYNLEMIEKEKGKRHNIFRDLGEVYKEPIYEEGDS